MTKLIFLFLLISSTIIGLSQETGSGHNLQFDGAESDYISISDNGSLDLQNEFTIEGWIYLTDAANNTIIDKGNYNYLFQTHSNSTSGLGMYNNVMGWKYSGGTVPSNTWCHVAATFSISANTLTFYLNGNVLGTPQVGISNPSLDNAEVNIGRQAPGSCSCNIFDGYMDELKVWNTALTQTEIRANMCSKVTASHAKYGNLLAYWKFDASSGTTVTDSKGSNNGTFVNSPTWNLSGAPIGDNSSYSYGSGNSTSVTQSHSDGSSFAIGSFTGSPAGAHVYLVNEAPNSTTNPTGFSSLETSRYYGTFIIDGTSPTHTVTYSYLGNNNINGTVNEKNTRLATRSNNSGTTWTANTGDLNTDIAANTITKCGQTSRMEYCAGRSSTTLQQKSGSGYILAMDGTGDYVTVNNSFSLECNDGTYECWIRPNWTAGTKGANPCIMSMRSGVGGDTRYSFHMNDALNAIGLYNGSSYGTVAYTFIKGDWYHVAFVDNGSNTEIFINGTSVGSTGNAISTGVTGKQLKLGFAEAAYSAEAWLGDIDEVRIWNSIKTSTDIRNNMCKKIKTYQCDLVAYYRFDNVGGSPTDYSSANDGTLVGNAAISGYSSAPIGDDSQWSASVSTGSTISLAHANGDQLTATITSGTANLMQLYRVDEAPNTTTPPGTMNSISNVDYFGVKLFGSSSGVYSVEYNYTGFPGVNSSNESELGLASRSSNSISSWTQENTAALNTGANTITLTGQTGTEFILGSTSIVVLPITLTSFDVQSTVNSNVIIEWVTASQINNELFIIERSIGNGQWETISEAIGAGTNSSELHYSTIDRAPYFGISYYRLKQIDFDGKYAYSEIKSVQVATGLSLEIYPNPSNSQLTLVGKGDQLNDFKIYNFLGQEVSSLLRILSNDEARILFDVSNLPAQVYTIKTKTDVIRFIKE